MTLGRHEPENVPMRLEMLRRDELVCGDRDESISRSDTRFLASLMTERSTPLPLTAPCHTHTKALSKCNMENRQGDSTLICATNLKGRLQHQVYSSDEDSATSLYVHVCSIFISFRNPVFNRLTYYLTFTISSPTSFRPRSLLISSLFFSLHTQQ